MDRGGVGGHSSAHLKLIMCSHVVSLTRLDWDIPRGRNISSFSCLHPSREQHSQAEWVADNVVETLPTLREKVWSVCQLSWSSETPELSHNQQCWGAQ